MDVDPKELRDVLDSTALKLAVEAVKAATVKRVMHPGTPDDEANNLRREAQALDRVIARLHQMASTKGAPDE